MCTEEADIDRVKRNEIPQMIIDAKALSAEPISDRWVNDLCNVEETSKKASRDREDREAIGGLRTPHLSVQKFNQAELFKDWLWPRLAKAVLADDVVDRTLASIGVTDTPLELLQIAKALREELAKELNTGALEGDGLQGGLDT